ncbi:hypothetical protein EDD22DRAFT_860515 [Suillus occidentalis]|nr:hypothetical protein EDD22DRAFT_860515 [Suillus occidentalis]
MAVLLIISYSSVSLVTLSDDSTFVMRSGQVVYPSNIFGLPVLLLGVTLLLQVVIAWSGIRAVKILAWSSSPFDLNAILVFKHN